MAPACERSSVIPTLRPGRDVAVFRGCPNRRNVVLTRQSESENVTRFSELQAAQLAAQDHDRGRAVRVVAGRSQNVDDCMELLAMLGLSADLSPRRDDAD